jgi:hypothetical protein
LFEILLRSLFGEPDGAKRLQFQNQYHSVAKTALVITRHCGGSINENSWRSCFSALHSDRLPNARHYAKQRFVAQFFRVARAAIGLALPLSPNGHALCISTTPARAADDHASDRGCSNPEHARRRQSLSTGDRRTAGSGGALGQPLVSLRSRLLTSSSRHGVTANRG